VTIYSVSDAYKTAIRARTRTDRVTGTLTLTNGTVLNLDAADLMSGSLTLDNQCVTGEELAFGCAYLGQAALNLRTDLSRHAFYGAKLVLHYGLQLPGGRWETVPLGVYTVAEAERRALYVIIKAYDNILALQQKYDGTTMQGTAYALLGQIAAACGLTLGQTEAEIGALNPNAALVCQLSGADGLSTWRECAAAVAQLVGGFAAADRAGRLVLRTFAEKPCAALTAAARSEAAVSDFACHYAALSIVDDLHEVLDFAQEPSAYTPDGDAEIVLKLAILDLDGSERVTNEKLTHLRADYQVVVSGKLWVDIMNIETDKKQGVEALQRVLGVTPAQTAVFGDYLNDLLMLEAGDWSFAMGNAHPDLKAAARYIAPSNVEHGVLKVVDRLVA